MSNLTCVPVVENSSAVLPGSPASWTVWATYPEAGVDRPQTSGTSTGPDRALADRLAAAMSAGVAHTDQEVRKDVHGRTYVADKRQYSGKRLARDLARMGY